MKEKKKRYVAPKYVGKKAIVAYVDEALVDLLDEVRFTNSKVMKVIPLPDSTRLETSRCDVMEAIIRKYFEGIEPGMYASAMQKRVEDLVSAFQTSARKRKRLSRTSASPAQEG